KWIMVEGSRKALTDAQAELTAAQEKVDLLQKNKTAARSKEMKDAHKTLDAARQKLGDMRQWQERALADSFQIVDADWQNTAAKLSDMFLADSAKEFGKEMVNQIFRRHIMFVLAQIMPEARDLLAQKALPVVEQFDFSTARSVADVQKLYLEVLARLQPVILSLRNQPNGIQDKPQYLLKIKGFLTIKNGENNEAQERFKMLGRILKGDTASGSGRSSFLGGLLDQLQIGVNSNGRIGITGLAFSISNSKGGGLISVPAVDDQEARAAFYQYLDRMQEVFNAALQNPGLTLVEAQDIKNELAVIAAERGRMLREDSAKLQPVSRREKAAKTPAAEAKPAAVTVSGFGNVDQVLKRSVEVLEPQRKMSRTVKAAADHSKGQRKAVKLDLGDMLTRPWNWWEIPFRVTYFEERDYAKAYERNQALALYVEKTTGLVQAQQDLRILSAARELRLTQDATTRKKILASVILMLQLPKNDQTTADNLEKDFAQWDIPALSAKIQELDKQIAALQLAWVEQALDFTRKEQAFYRDYKGPRVVNILGFLLRPIEKLLGGKEKKHDSAFAAVVAELEQNIKDFEEQQRQLKAENETPAAALNVGVKPGQTPAVDSVTYTSGTFAGGDYVRVNNTAAPDSSFGSQSRLGFNGSQTSAQMETQLGAVSGTAGVSVGNGNVLRSDLSLRMPWSTGLSTNVYVGSNGQYRLSGTVMPSGIAGNLFSGWINGDDKITGGMNATVHGLGGNIQGGFDSSSRNLSYDRTMGRNRFGLNLNNGFGGTSIGGHWGNEHGTMTVSNIGSQYGMTVAGQYTNGRDSLAVISASRLSVDWTRTLNGNARAGFGFGGYEGARASWADRNWGAQAAVSGFSLSRYMTNGAWGANYAFSGGLQLNATSGLADATFGPGRLVVGYNRARVANSMAAGAAAQQVRVEAAAAAYRTKQIEEDSRRQARLSRAADVNANIHEIANPLTRDGSAYTKFVSDYARYPRAIEYFNRMLARQGLDTNAVRSVIAQAGQANPQQTPEELETLRVSVQRVAQAFNAGPGPAIDSWESTFARYQNGTYSGQRMQFNMAAFLHNGSLPAAELAEVLDLLSRPLVKQAFKAQYPQLYSGDDFQRDANGNYTDAVLTFGESIAQAIGAGAT
ncbi:MAG: hypothetical protein HQL23_09640, partial [Candidatus Omnitrophica bacterium]|nr:hypothetical protein [Candidatus Omnitrophota bacterium]